MRRTWKASARALTGNWWRCWEAGRRLPMTYAGGISRIQDFDEIDALSGGAMDATAGSALGPVRGRPYQVRGPGGEAKREIRDGKAQGMKLALKVIPNAKKSEAAGWEDDPRAGRVLKLRIAAPPVEGKANRAVILFLSAWLDVPRSAVSLLRGESARLKVVELPDGCAEKLARLLPEAGVPEA